MRYTFNNDSSEKKLKNLINSYNDFNIGEPNVQRSEHLSIDAWHLIDWIFEEFPNIHNQTRIEHFRETLYSKCPSLKIMHDIANSVKHSKISRPKANIREMDEYIGAFSSEFSGGFDITRLEIILEDESILDFNNEIEKVISFWIDYFNNILNIKINN